MAVREHWQRVYVTKQPHEVSWYQQSPERSLTLIRQLDLEPDARIIDVGGGSSSLVDELLALGFRDLSVLDVAEEPLEQVQRRLGAAAADVEWIVADVTEFEPQHQWDLWHDRAVFHFLTSDEDRAAYRRALDAGLAAGGHAVVSTFGPDGPRACSGLPVQRYDASSLAGTLQCGLTLQTSVLECHHTPAGAEQEFLYCVMRRPGDPHDA
jgi:2-polyprenyl-3-methyl-5-hydroxy-6-metoxy-1,4-benzoquinol methylase